MELKIQCAAIWYNDGKERTHNPKNIKTGIVICGLRHCNCFPILFELFPNREYLNNDEDEMKIIQGFLVSDGRFVDRKYAYKIALIANQVGVLKNEILFSEDLY